MIHFKGLPQYSHRVIVLLFIIIILSGVRLSPLGTAAIIGILYKPQMIIMVLVEQFVESRLAGKAEVHGQILPQCHFVHHKFHMT
jgi:hypothetical protein